MENQQKVWDKIALPWKDFRKTASPSVEQFLSGRQGRVLDDGCGSGRNFIKTEGLEWYGTDFSKEMLKYARIDAEKKGIKVDLRLVKSEDLPFDDGFFDAVICVRCSALY
jgi:2-polyprenyl-3-methyl-5-hydroxy-6-metoxy-1,4-benzoquinol methylase